MTRIEGLPDEGVLHLLHPDDVNLKIQMLLEFYDVDYMLDAQVPRGQVVTINVSEIFKKPTPPWAG